MKNIIKNNKNNIDAIAEARKSKEFQEYSKDADLRIKLAVEIYNAREKMGWSQQKLAKEIGSTQKVISKIENGDVNIGVELLNRLAEKLNFDSRNLAMIFNIDEIWINIPLSVQIKSERSETIKDILSFNNK